MKNVQVYTFAISMDCVNVRLHFELENAPTEIERFNKVCREFKVPHISKWDFYEFAVAYFQNCGYQVMDGKLNQRGR